MFVRHLVWQQQQKVERNPNAGMRERERHKVNEINNIIYNFSNRLKTMKGSGQIIRKK